MEQTTERKINWQDIVMYDDEGKRITNPKTLRAMAQSEELADEWERRIERYHIEDVFRRHEEEDEENDCPEEKVV